MIVLRNKSRHGTCSYSKAVSWAVKSLETLHGPIHWNSYALHKTNLEVSASPACLKNNQLQSAA